MVDGFLALGASFFLSPQHRLRKRVNSSSLTHRAYSTVANPTVLPSRLALSSCVNQTPQSNFLTNSPRASRKIPILFLHLARKPISSRYGRASDRFSGRERRALYPPRSAGRARLGQENPVQGLDYQRHSRSLALWELRRRFVIEGRRRFHRLHARLLIGQKTRHPAPRPHSRMARRHQEPRPAESLA